MQLVIRQHATYKFWEGLFVVDEIIDKSVPNLN